LNIIGFLIWFFPSESFAFMRLSKQTFGFYYEDVLARWSGSWNKPQLKSLRTLGQTIADTNDGARSKKSLFWKRVFSCYMLPMLESNLQGKTPWLFCYCRDVYFIGNRSRTRVLHHYFQITNICSKKLGKNKKMRLKCYSWILAAFLSLSKPSKLQTKFLCVVPPHFPKKYVGSACYSFDFIFNINNFIQFFTKKKNWYILKCCSHWLGLNQRYSIHSQSELKCFKSEKEPGRV